MTCIMPVTNISGFAVLQILHLVSSCTHILALGTLSRVVPTGSAPGEQLHFRAPWRPDTEEQETAGTGSSSCVDQRRAASSFGELDSILHQAINRHAALAGGRRFLLVCITNCYQHRAFHCGLLARHASLIWQQWLCIMCCCLSVHPCASSACCARASLEADPQQAACLGSLLC